MANNGAESHIKKHLDLCLTVCRKYSWLIDSYVLDFFIERHFQRLPRSWSYHLKNVSNQELAAFLDYENSQLQIIWPLSFTSLRSLVKHLSLPRKLCRNDLINFQNLPDNETYSNIHNNHAKENSNGIAETEYGNLLLTNTKLKKLFTKHVKSKKRYEIMEMAKITSEIAESMDIKHMVDIGSGLGHLSRISGYGYNLNVLSVESQKNLFNIAQKFDSELEITAGKHLGEDEIKMIKKKRPILVQKTITGDMTSDEFLNLIRESFKTEEKEIKFCIVGLHPCGNLALKLLQLFSDCEEAKFISLVGCCYHKFTVSGNAEEYCFPISNYCKQRKINLSNEARSLACHALETYCRRLRMNDCDRLKIHCFRAALENIIYKNWPHLRKSALNNVKHEPFLTFKLYCEKALRKTEISISDEDLESEETLNALAEWKSVVLYYSLRLMLAPLLETIILLDRALYVIENGHQCSIQALFEPETSPRNFVLIAKKL